MAFTVKFIFINAPRGLEVMRTSQMSNGMTILLTKHNGLDLGVAFLMVTLMNTQEFLASLKTCELAMDKHQSSLLCLQNHQSLYFLLLNIIIGIIAL